MFKHYFTILQTIEKYFNVLYLYRKWVMWWVCGWCLLYNFKVKVKSYNTEIENVGEMSESQNKQDTFSD